MTGSNTSIRTKTRHPADFFTYVAIYVCAILSVALLLGIIVYVFVKGIRSVNWEFLTSVTSVLKGTTGIAGNIVNTLYIIIVTMLIATPIGVGYYLNLDNTIRFGLVPEFGNIWTGKSKFLRDHFLTVIILVIKFSHFNKQLNSFVIWHKLCSLSFS